MGTRLHVPSVAVEYILFYPFQEVMDRFMPSSKQPPHWSRNYNGSQEKQRRAGPESEKKSVRPYRQGVRLKAEDLLGEQRVMPINFLSPKEGDRRDALGGSATQLTNNERPKAPLRRSSEGSYTLRRKSSSSSNAADDPTSSENSSSSESGCNGDSETCSYCRLSSCECTDSSDRRHKLARARSEDCKPPSKGRRTSPGEYLRYKRDQMERLQTLQRYDSRLQLRTPSRQAYHRRLSEDQEAGVTNREKPPPNSFPSRNTRKSKSKEQPWSGSEDSIPTFTCSVCECDIPFTNCVLCSAEAKGQFLSQENEFLIQDTEAEILAPGDTAADDKKELEEFYDGPIPVNSPRREQWISKGDVMQKSFNQEDLLAFRRKNLHLRKYNSEPVPDREFCFPRSQSEASKSEDSCCSSAGRKSGFHVASPSKAQPDESSGGIDAEKELPRKSPVFLKPEFVFEPEIIHKANPLVDEAEVDVLPSAREAFRRLSMEEYLSTVSIHEAAGKGDLHVVKLLTKKDCKQMETVDERGWTPIHLAAAHGHEEVVKYLAAEGAHLSALDPSSYTALHLAAMNGHNSCVEVLLPMGVDVDSVTSEGFTPLHLAVMNGHLECIQTLLQWGSSLEKRDALGRGVYEMVEEYNLEEVATLLKNFHKQLHNFKHVLDILQHRKEGRSASEMPQEFMDMLASIAEETSFE